MHYLEAARVLGIHEISLLRLVREGKIERTGRGQVSDEDVDMLLAQLPPRGVLNARAAADALGISPKHIGSLLALGFLTGGINPQSNENWILPSSVDRLKEEPRIIAERGIRVEPPPGYARAEYAMEFYDISRSQLCKLARAGEIHCIRWSAGNIFYRVGK